MLRRSEPRPALSLALLVLLTAPLSAQASGDRVGDLRPGAYIRARLGADRTVTGQFIPVGDGRVGIRTEQGSTDTLRLREIGELAVRGRHTKTGAIVGGIAGVGFGLFIGWIVENTCDAAVCEGGPYEETVPLFGAGGALLGAAIGSAFPKWKKVFP